MASILDIQNQFYPLLVRFLADENQVSTLAMDEAESAYEYYVSIHGKRSGKRGGKKDQPLIGKQAKALVPAVSALVKNTNGAPLARWILELPEEYTHTVAQVILSEAVLDNELIGHRRLRLLIVHWASHELRLWSNKGK
jgi:hypothetical protein